MHLSPTSKLGYLSFKKEIRFIYIYIDNGMNVKTDSGCCLNEYDIYF